jgi:tRNA modification GTPase
MRCAESLRLVEVSLASALRLVEAREGEELIAAEVRLALGELGLVVGAVYTDDLLDRIFSQFCIGK